MPAVRGCLRTNTVATLKLMMFKSVDIQCNAPLDVDLP